MRSMRTAAMIALLYFLRATSLAQADDCRTWRVVPTPDIGGLFKVAASGPANIWAVGTSILLHWDGEAWHVVPGPDRPVAGIDVSENEVWLVGTEREGTRSHALAFRRRDGVWQRERIPALVENGVANSAGLFAVAIDGDDHVVAVGAYSVADPEPRSGALIIEWSDLARYPARAPIATLIEDYSRGARAVAAVGPDDFWIVGGQTQTRGPNAGTGSMCDTSLRFEHGVWSAELAGECGSSALGPNVLTASGPNNVWAVGNLCSHGQCRGYGTRWDGRAWSARFLFDYHPQGFSQMTEGAVAVYSDDVWIVGTTGSNGRGAYSLNWNGRSFVSVEPPNAAQSSLNGVARAGSDIWAVGASYPSSRDNRSQSLVLRLDPNGCSSRP